MKLNELHLKQPKAQMKQVWQTDEHQGQSKGRWHNKYEKKAQQYKWPPQPFKGKAVEYDSHILK